MEKKKQKNNNQEVSYWKSSTDLLSALLLLLLLVILLLILYLLQLPREQYTHFMGIDEGLTSTEDESESMTEPESVSETETTGQQGNGGGESTSETETTTVVQAGTPEEGDGEKSAVYVMLIDAETQRTVKEAGVTFELYADDNGLQILNTYYPERITYRTYETTEKGVFYLPEKVYEDGYYLRELTEASGYDMAEDQHFVIDHYYDWPEPYVVRVPVRPSRNIIRVQMNDRENGQSVGAGRFEVVAAEDILTLDGTLRYRDGEIVDTIVCDADGYGESSELYLGKYYIRQTDIPKYYAGLTGNIEHEVMKKTEVANVPEQIYNEKTRVTLTLTDELTGQPIENAQFRVYYDGGAASEDIYTTNNAGKITIDSIEKDTTYYFAQEGSVGDYIPLSEPASVAVSRSGRIGTDPEIDLSAVNRMLRLNIGMKDAVLGNQIADKAMSLFDSDGGLIRTWTTSGTPASFTGLTEGTYRLVVGGDESKPYYVSVNNTADMQQFTVSTWTWLSYLAVIGGVLLAALTGISAFALIRTRKKKKAEHPAGPGGNT